MISSRSISHWGQKECVDSGMEMEFGGDGSSKNILEIHLYPTLEKGTMTQLPRRLSLKQDWQLQAVQGSKQMVGWNGRVDVKPQHWVTLWKHWDHRGEMIDAFEKEFGQLEFPNYPCYHGMWGEGDWQQWTCFFQEGQQWIIDVYYMAFLVNPFDIFFTNVNSPPWCSKSLWNA